MDRFVTRKKRKSSDDGVPDSKPELLPAATAIVAPRTHEDRENDDNEPTDIKLAMLSSIHPDIAQDLLLDLLLAHDGSVKDTLEALKASTYSHKTKNNSSSSSGIRAVGAQTSLRPFTTSTFIDTITPATPAPTSTESSSPQKKKKPKLLARKGATLHLYDPEDISCHTPCTVVHNFLPEEEANGLLRELLEEAKSFQKITFKLFENVVSSPHTSGFYVGSDYELTEQKSEYVYNGARIEVSLFFFVSPPLPHSPLS